MPNAGYTDVTVLLDRSGSMQSIKTDTEGGFNAFVEDQKRLPGECRLTLVQFDNEYEFVYRGVPVADVAPLNLMPRGGTALLDAIGRSISETGERLAKLPEHQRPQNVVFVIITDGQENASREYGRERVFAMVKHQSSKYNWQFIYLGANQDAIAVGGSFGVNANACANYGTSKEAVAGTYSVASGKLGALRSKGVYEDFTAEERRIAASGK